MMAEQGAPRQKRSWFNMIGAGVLLVSYVIAIQHMIEVHTTENRDDPDTIVLRFTHWQLESGVREALDAMSRKFEKRYFEDTGKRVKLIQNPISERAYRQYVQTQCIGRTAPDLIEIGKYDNVYTVRYFHSNTEDVRKPNPYNKGTELEGVPWAETYRDGMRGSLEQSNLEYYGAGLSTVSVRLFYNKRLFQEVLGSDAPPRNYRHFLEICERFQQWAEEKGMDDFVPIAGARYQLNIFNGRFSDCVKHDFILSHDVNYDGFFNSSEECLFAYAAGDYSFDDPALRAGHELLAKMTHYFPAGFMAMDRMEAGFRFTQGKAAFITSGTWDALSYFLQSDFPIAVIDFPLPGKDDPEVGHLVRGRTSESSFFSAFRFGITKFSRHPDVALAWLQFMTTKENNEEFNRLCQWIPLIKGAESHPAMKPFMHDPEGFWGGNPFQIMWGGLCGLLYEQALWELVEHKVDYDGFVKMLDDGAPRAMALDFERILDRNREGRQKLDLSISGHAAVQLFAHTWGLPPEEADALEAKSTRKLKYQCESRGRYLREGYWRWKWKQLLDEGCPRALAIQKFVSGSLGLDEGGD
jgi:raffinose/stachyose/melibiose transport system substrate-binding protein